MTISNGEQERKKAIIDRIQQILDNAKHIYDLSIKVDAPRGGAPTIEYSITEFISVEDNENEQKI